MLQPVEGTRRTANVRTRGRAARVVKRVLTAAAAELSRVGYAALSIEEVAARSGVNKTTIYRRWPTKAELVAAALTAIVRQRPAIDTGTLRGDLRASLLMVLELKPAERGIMRVFLTERTVPEVDVLARRFRDELFRMRVAMVERAVARGELPAGVDARLVVDLVSAPVHRALAFHEPLHASYIERVLDVVLAGAAACVSASAFPCSSRPSRSPRRSR
jgi:AcrR family transcriptional regulator